ncbi:MAG: Stp1/IreP family PP2C-type Ser/Thr phosphatase [Firmicutes bacterium]|nr:Stp1/IreP family PP2C-type Ser/Thr phosphatase [Bacillota bacterium]
MQGFGLTHRGRERSRNEDRFLTAIGPETTLLAVADGMGGHVAGDVASTLAIETVERYWKDLSAKIAGGGLSEQEIASIVENLILEANQVIYRQASKDPARQGMGTTLTLGLLNGLNLTIGHVGDSRGYLIADGRISLLTRDHSLLEQMIANGLVHPGQEGEHPQRHVLTRAVGTGPRLEVDLVQRVLTGGSALLFCTDGLTSLVEDEEILQIYLDKREPYRVASSLIELANLRSGIDNITVVLLTGIGKREENS